MADYTKKSRQLDFGCIIASLVKTDAICTFITDNQNIKVRNYSKIFEGLNMYVLFLGRSKLFICYQRIISTSASKNNTIFLRSSEQ